MRWMGRGAPCTRRTSLVRRSQRKEGEKGKWWEAAVSGVEKVRNTLRFGMIYDAQRDVESTEDKLDVHTKHVVWLE